LQLSCRFLLASCSAAAWLATAAGVHFVPVADGGAARAAVRASVVDPSVVLARRVDFAGALGPVAAHVGLDACLGASHLLCTRLKVDSRLAAINPVGVLDLIGSAAERPTINSTATNIPLTTFHLADALQAVAGYGRFDAAGGQCGWWWNRFP